MWKLKIAEGRGPYLFSTTIMLVDKFGSLTLMQGRQKSEQQLKKHEKNIKRNEKKNELGLYPVLIFLCECSLKKENNDIDLSIPPVRLGEKEVAHEAATIALRKAIRLNRVIQASDGHWAAENAGPMFFTPPLNDDGGWGFYIEGHSTMIGSALNYVALRLLGEGPDNGERAMTKARQWILDNGSATGIPSWGKTHLSVLGVYEWAGCNPLPPEFWLFLSFSPCHPAKMWCYCRTTYMPMSYLYGRKYHGPITNLVKSLRQEIHPKPYEEINWNKARHDCCKEDLYYHHTFIQNLLWNSLHYLSEPIMNCCSFNRIRERAIQKTVKYMRYGAESSRYITIGCVEKSLQMMCWWVENPDGNEFKHHLARTPDYLWLAEDGMKMQSIGSQIWDTTLATQAIIASNMADEYGNSLRKAHVYIKESQSIEGKKANNESAYDAVNVLLFLQSPESGGFAIWEPPVPLPTFWMLNPSELFADIVVETEHVECTASIIHALLQWPNGS
ncbi:unnamed protein product [Camellia sinensis]